MQNSKLHNVLLENREGTAWIAVNRPDKLNALNRRTVGELVRAVELAEADTEVRAVAIRGAGDKAFVAGADIEEMAGLGPAEAQRFSRFLQESLDRIERCTKPVLAVVNGYALGGGCELALACHLRFASENARFGQPEVSLGLIPGAGGTQRLPRLVGRGRALELILGGEMIGAVEAQSIGLVNRVFPAESLEREVVRLLEKWFTKSPLAQARALEAVIAGESMPQLEALRLEAGLFALGFASEDMREGTRAFLEKRKASFTGR